MKTLRSLLFVLAALVAVAVPAVAQAPVPVTLTVPQATSITMVPLSATAAVNNATTITIPAPAGGLSNYVCSLSFNVSNDGTGTAITNQATTSTNFNSFAIKISQPATNNLDSGVINVFAAQPAGGCAKSTVPGTATTFVSPSGLTHATWTWYAVYYQAP